MVLYVSKWARKKDGSRTFSSISSCAPVLSTMTSRRGGGGGEVVMEAVREGMGGDLATTGEVKTRPL